MTKKIQLKKNLKLTEKLATYIIDNPSVTKGIPSNASYVFYSATDKKLNKTNDAIIKSLLNQGTAVVKAQETQNTKIPWKLTPVSP